MKYYVRLTRTIHERLDLKVEADSSWRAKEEALEKAEYSDNWLPEFNGDAEVVSAKPQG